MFGRSTALRMAVFDAAIDAAIGQPELLDVDLHTRDFQSSGFVVYHTNTKIVGIHFRFAYCDPVGNHRGPVEQLSVGVTGDFDKAGMLGDSSYLTAESMHHGHARHVWQSSRGVCKITGFTWNSSLMEFVLS